ncbi:MAG: TetR/AcrR family transcriptional regulator [Pseudomonadota bacterium]
MTEEKFEQLENTMKNPSAQRVIAAGRELFFMNGFEGATTDALAKAAGVSKTTIYKHFGSMEGVFSAVVMQSGQEITGGVPQTPDTEEAFWESLQQWGEQLLSFISSAPAANIYRLMLENARDHGTLAHGFYNDAFEPTHKDLTARIVYGQQQGYLRKDIDPRHAAEIYVGALEGLAFSRLSLRLTDDPYPDVTSRVVATLSLFRHGAMAT